jgi:hypothetical protein
MTTITCRAGDCIHWDEGVCSLEQITYDLEKGCLLYGAIEDVLLGDEEEWKNVEMLDDEPLEWDGDEDSVPDEDDEGWDV